MDRKYNLRLDLQFRCNNSVMKFDEFDKNTSDFFIRVTRGNKLIDISKAIVTLVVIKPDNTTEAQFVTIENNNVYCDLKPSMKDIPGKYEAIASITVNGETINTDPTNPIVYEVTENKFLRQLNEEVVSEERFTILTEMISRLSEIELQEISRQEAELSREEAEKLRQEAIEKIKSDIAKLIEDTNSNVDKLISDTETKIDNYKLEKDAAIQQDLQQYKIDTTQDIDNYKNLKDAEIDKNLEDYKTATTRNIDAYKNLKNTEIDNYKTEKDLEIDTYVASKNKELDIYAAAKNAEINEYKDLKDTLINDKLKEADTAEQSRADAEQKRQQEHVNREQFLNGFESQLEQIENKNIEQDTRLKEVEYKNKVQDVYISGLFNENKDGRLSVEGEGNSLKLEGSKKGLVTVDKVVGDTTKSIPINLKTNLPNVQGTTLWENINRVDNVNYWTTTVTSSSEATNNALSLNIWGGEISQGLVVGNTYTLVIYDCPKTSDYSHYLFRDNTLGLNYSAFKEDKLVFKAKGDGTVYGLYSVSKGVSNGTTVTMNFPKHWLILEGDYTNKPIPSEYFEGIQSTFEDKLITQEMVDNGEESAENLGKYRVGVKVVGKNKFKGSILQNNEGITVSNLTNNSITLESNSNGGWKYVKLFEIKCRQNKDFVLSCNIVREINATTSTLRVFGNTTNDFICNVGLVTGNSANTAFNTGKNTKIMILAYTVSSGELPELHHKVIFSNIKLEEGTVATQYEPYREYKTSILLDEPLYEDNELTVHEGKLGYWKNRFRKIFDGNTQVTRSANSDQKVLTSHYMIVSNNYDGYIPNIDKNVICDMFATKLNIGALVNVEYECITNSGGQLWININKSKLSSDTIAGFKAWLQTNPITIEYMLETPTFVPILENMPKLVSEIPNNATLHIDSIIPCQSVKASYTGKLPSVYKLENDISTIEELNVDIVATNFDMDYRLLEIEWALEDAGITGINLFNILNTNKGVKNMALSRYEQAKIMIIGGAYDKEVLTKQLTRYLEKKIITQQEYDELIALMEAKELVTGE